MTSQANVLQHLLKDVLDIEDIKIAIINIKGYKGINKLKGLKVNTVEKWYMEGDIKDTTS